MKTALVVIVVTLAAGYAASQVLVAGFGSLAKVLAVLP